MKDLIVLSPRWIFMHPGHPFRTYASLIFGLESTKEYTRDGGVYVDASIAELVANLNRAGYFTTTSCSGDDDEHEYKTKQGHRHYGCLGMRMDGTPGLKLPSIMELDENLRDVKPEVGDVIWFKEGVTQEQARTAWKELSATVYDMVNILK